MAYGCFFTANSGRWPFHTLRPLYFGILLQNDAINISGVFYTRRLKITQSLVINLVHNGWHQNTGLAGGVAKYFTTTQYGVRASRYKDREWTRVIFACPVCLTKTCFGKQLLRRSSCTRIYVNVGNRHKKRCFEILAGSNNRVFFLFSFAWILWAYSTLVSIHSLLASFPMTILSIGIRLYNKRLI